MKIELKIVHSFHRGFTIWLNGNDQLYTNDDVINYLDLQRKQFVIEYTTSHSIPALETNSMAAFVSVYVVVIKIFSF